MKIPTIARQWLDTRRQQKRLQALTLARLSDLALVLQQRLNNPRDPLLCPVVAARWVHLGQGTWLRADDVACVTEQLETVGPLKMGARVWLRDDPDPIVVPNTGAAEVVALLAGVDVPTAEEQE